MAAHLGRVPLLLCKVPGDSQTTNNPHPHHRMHVDWKQGVDYFILLYVILNHIHILLYYSYQMADQTLLLYA